MDMGVNWKNTSLICLSEVLFLVTVCLTCWCRLALLSEVFNIFMPLLVGRYCVSLVRISDRHRGMAFHLGVLANEVLCLILVSLRKR